MCRSVHRDKTNKNMTRILNCKLWMDSQTSQPTIHDDSTRGKIDIYITFISNMHLEFAYLENPPEPAPTLRATMEELI